MTWTTEKPTKPGRYELSIEPGRRAGRVPFPHYILADVENVPARFIDEGNEVEPRELAVKYVSGGAWNRLSESWFDGALWRKYQEPADPFVNPVTITDSELPYDRGFLRIEDDGESVIALISPSIAGGSATDRLRDLRAAVLSAGEWLTRLCDRG